MKVTSISFVVPVYSGFHYLSKLVDEILDQCAQWSADGTPLTLLEICLVNDEAKDGSADLIDQLASLHSEIKPLHLARNFGQHAATIAGVLHTSGDWVVTLDEDLQHPPRQALAMLKKAVSEGHDVVYANAESAVHQSRLRDWGSRGYKTFVEAVSGNRNIRIFNSFRLIRGDIARAAAATCGHDTYFDISLSWYTQRIGQEKMRLKDDRFIATGKSGYKLGRLISHARRMLMSNGAKSMRFAGLVGISASVLALLTMIALILIKFVLPGYAPVQGWASIMVTIILFGGLTMTLIAAVLEFLSVLVLRAHGKPLFFVIDRSNDILLRDYFSKCPESASGEIPNHYNQRSN